MNKNIFKKPFTASVLALSIISCIIRVFLLKSNIETLTGFYINPYSLTRILLIILIVASLLFGFFWSYLVKKRGVLPINLRFDFKEFFSERVILAIVAIGFAANTFYEIFRISNPLNSLIITKSIVFFSILTAITSAASLIYFIILSFLYENNKFGRSLFCITPIIWIIFRLLKDFISFDAITTVSKNLLDIIYLSALLITLYALGSIFSEVDNPKALKLYHILSPITIVLGFVLSVPVIIGFIFSFETIGESDVFMHIIDFALSLFLLRASMYIYSEN